MSATTRRQFIQASAAVAASMMIGSSFGNKKKKALLSFTTLGCPDWSLQQIVDFAVTNGYKAIEMRGLQRQIDLPKCPEFSTESGRSATMKLMNEKGLQFINLGSSATLHFAEGAERDKNISDGKRFIDLAQQVNCPYVRVYPNNFPKGQERNVTLELITKGLIELGDYARERNVSVLMETHGEVVRTEDLESVMRAASHKHVGLIWDPCNMWRVTKESPTEMYRKLKPYIHHTHIKDCILVNGNPEYKLLGQGEVPIFEAVDLLFNDGYKGYYSFEWEKLWHPELLEPEVALSDYPKAMKKHLGKKSF